MDIITILFYIPILDWVYHGQSFLEEPWERLIKDELIKRSYEDLVEMFIVL